MDVLIAILLSLVGFLLGLILHDLLERSRHLKFLQELETKYLKIYEEMKVANIANGKLVEGMQDRLLGLEMLQKAARPSSFR